MVAFLCCFSIGVIIEVTVGARVDGLSVISARIRLVLVNFIVRTCWASIIGTEFFIGCSIWARFSYGLEINLSESSALRVKF